MKTVPCQTIPSKIQSWDGSDKNKQHSQSPHSKHGQVCDYFTQQHITEVAKHEQNKLKNVSFTKLSTSFKNQIQIADDPTEQETRENHQQKRPKRQGKITLKIGEL